MFASRASPLSTSGVEAFAISVRSGGVCVGSGVGSGVCVGVVVGIGVGVEVFVAIGAVVVGLGVKEGADVVSQPERSIITVKKM